MGTDWSTDTTIASRGQQEWSTRIISADSSKDDKIASEAPEQIFLTFEELDIIPQEIEGDAFYINTWTLIDHDSAVGVGGWATIVYSGGTAET